MNKLIILLVLIAIMIVGGGLTSQLAAQGGFQLPVLRQTDNPDASALEMTPWKAEQLFLVIMFILFSPLPPGIIPMAIGITALMWFLDWQVKVSKKTAAASSGSAITPASETKPAKAE